MVDEPFHEAGLLAQARRNADERLAFLRDHGALTAEGVAEFAGSTAGDRRRTAHRWCVDDRSIFAIEHRGRPLYPAFQFDARTRRPIPAVAEALRRLPVGLSGWALALWWDTPVVDDGRWVTPCEVIDDTHRVVRLAEAEAARWQSDAVV